MQLRESKSMAQELTTEQHFAVAAFKTQVERMSREQLIDMCNLLYRQNLINKTFYIELIGKEWGIINDA